MRSISTVCAALLATVATVGCGPRTVVVGTDPSPSAPQAGQAADQANDEVLREELSLLAEAQEEYFTDHERFAESTGELGFAPRGGIRLDVLQGDQAGYSAIARFGDSECGIFAGDVRAPRSYVTLAGVPDCRP